MEVTLKYGVRGLRVRLPDTPGFTGVLEPKAVPALPAPDQAVAAALRDPIDASPLAGLASGRRDACIVISDITRPAAGETMER